MSTHGTVTAFDRSKEDWTSYVERLDFYFAANDVTTDEKKRAILLSACGASTYKLIRSLIEPDKLNSTPYTDITKSVKEHYDPKPSSIVQRHKFNTRIRAPGETIAAYVAALRELAEHCDYKDTLSDMLRDRLVCGVNHEVIQQKLMSTKNLTYTTALEFAQAIEAAEKNAQHVATNSNPPTPQTQGVHYTPATASKSRPKGKNAKGSSSSQGSRLSCHRCGGPHLATGCRFKEAVCYVCRKRGHIARVCRSKGRRSQGAHCVQEDSEHHKTSGDQSYSMFTVKGQTTDPIFKEVHINNVPVKMELDTGASLSVVTYSTYQEIRESSSI